MFYTPCTFVCLICSYASGVYTPTCPHTPCASVCYQRLLHVVGVVRGPLTCWTPPLHLPYMGCLPFSLPPHSFVGFPVHWYVLGISVIWGFFPFVWGLGCSPICWGFGGISTWDVHMLILLHFCSSLCLMFLLWL